MPINRFLILVFLLPCLFGAEKVWAQCTIGEPVIISLHSTGQDSFTIPTGVTSIRVQVWGAGGRGGTITNNGEGGGGGGGAYSESTITVTPGTNYVTFVGRGSDTEEDGQDSWLSTSSNFSNAVVLAKGGESAGNNKNGKKGGKNNGIGSVRFSGGDGGDGKDDNGGGGGSSASPDGNGRNGEDGDDGSDGGEARDGGGNGGAGQKNNSGDGDPGIEPGGGGGGGTRNGPGTSIGGKGGNGKLIISYICPSCGLTSTFSASIQQFIVPVGVSQITMKAWGGGGKGGSTTENVKSGGGGAGAYSESTITVTPGETLYYFSGAGSSLTNAEGDSWVSRGSDGSNPFILARQGNSVANNVTIGGTGGLASQGVGTIRTNGGNGSSAGGDGGDGGDSPNGGDGGDGGDGGQSDGDPGEFPGGGGGGAKANNGNRNKFGGSGGNGQISFSYSCEEPVDPPGGGCWRYVDDGSVSGIVIIEFFENCTWNAPQGLLEFEVLAIGGGGGGGAHSGGGGGSGGIVHGKVDIEAASVFGLLADTPFEIIIGAGGLGSPANNKKADDGKNSIFNSASTFHPTAGGVYQITAGGGGGGGSDSGGGGNASGKGNTGFLSSKSNETNMIQLTLYNGSGGGASHPSNNGGGGQNRNGGNGSTHSGGGGGGVLSSGENGNTSEQGGTGGTGQQFNQFDKNLKRFFSGGGGGGSEATFQAPGGSGAGGNGAYNGPGQTGKTPGSGGGGGGHSGDERGGNGAKGVVFVKYEIARILPVEYLYYKADYNSFMRSGELSWSTAQEWENSHFEIERSVNDTRNWTKVDEVTGQGYSDIPVEYSFSDLNLPSSGGNIFYRLKQVDWTGNFAYSVTRAIQVAGLDGSTSWIAYPNPSALRSTISVDLLDRSGYAEESILIRISDAKGVFESYSVSSPEEVSAVVNSYLDQARPGLHILQLIWGNKSEQLKLIRK